MDLRIVTELKEFGTEFTEDGLAQLEKCIKFINEKRPDLEENFISRFKYLGEQPKRKLTIWTDFAPLSFYFVAYWRNPKTDQWERDFNGGIIFHGNHDGGGNGGAPTFSVNLEAVDGWSIHT